MNYDVIPGEILHFRIKKTNKQTNKKYANTGSAIKAYLVCKSSFKAEDYINISLTGTGI